MEREYRPSATAWSMNCTPQPPNGFDSSRSYIPSCMRTSRHRLAVGLFIAGCQSAPAPVSRSVPEPETRRSAPPVSPSAAGSFERGIAPRTAPPLPAIPLVVGPLSPHVVYPEPNQSISVRDSNFIFGSVGNGHATLTINGVPVPVAPNGTFLGFLPVPPPTAARYELIVREGADSARLVVPVRVPPAASRPVDHGATRHRFGERVAARRIDDAARERAGSRHCPRARRTRSRGWR